MAARIAVKNILAKCFPSKLSLNLGRVVLVKDLFLSIHHGSVPMICSASEASGGEVPVSRKWVLRLGVGRTFKFFPEVKLQ